MIRAVTTMRTLCAVILAASIFTAGCGSKSFSQTTDGGNTVNIKPAALLASINSSSIQHSLDGWKWDSFITSFSSLMTSLTYTLDMQKVTYQSTGADGKMHSMTGLLILPRSIFGDKPSVPILMYQHGTEVYRPFSPSRFLAHLDRPKDYPEVMVAAAIASTGYAVALVDYEGMGDNTDTQPHVVGATLALQVVDLLRASRDIIGGTAGNSSSPCTWNSQLFLMGYSEGGYVTMATTKELQLPKYAGEFTVTASAPLSGPHDLSGIMRGIILSYSTIKAPYFAPLLLSGYNYAYGAQTTGFSPGFAMSSPYDTTIPPLFNGDSTSDKISEAMGMTFSPVKLIVPKSILTQQFIDQLTSDTSTVVALLRQNDSYRDWAPTVPMRMIHHNSDELVPYGNSQVAFDAFSTAGAKSHISRGPGVELVEETATIDISADPVKTVHFGAAFPELSDGWNWLNGFKN
ncbi:MAG: lipase family protein [Desulfuromonadaceae bacterium]|nr:lipase family protein [Desulfuromonadaceae bacterium]